MVNIKEVYGIIYCVINIINDKKYIGQTIRDLNKRKNEHISLSQNGSEFAFHQALRKYGEENFEWIILDVAYNQEELDKKECYWIDYYDTYNQGGYNMSVGGQFNKKDYCDADDLSKMYGGREFLVYDLDGNFIKSTFSQTEFADEIGVCVQTVNNVLKGIKNSTNDYILIFKDEFNENVLKDKINKIKDRHKDFAVFDVNNEFIGIWNNKVHCENELNVSRRAIQRQLNQNKGVKKARKYKFYYLENIPNKLKNKIKEVI